VRWFVKGDFDGLFGLGLNNFINFLLIINLSLFVLGFSVELVLERILPAMGVAILFGNLFYGWQARRLGLQTNRDDVTALPYGINLLPIFFFIFYVMLPAQQIALSQGLSKEEADLIAWKAGVIACLGSGVIELFGSFFVHHLRRVAPRAALLSALAVIGIFFIGADYFFRAYAFPAIGIPTLFLTLYFYYGGIRLKWNLPGGLIILAVGVATAWITYYIGMPSPVDDLTNTGLQLGVYLPGAYGLGALGAIGEMVSYAAIILPMGLINVVGSMQAIESAAAAGDDFAPRETLVINGVGSLIAGGLGSPFPTTLYIGHLGMKQIGARAGYSILNGIAMALLCLTGSFGLIARFVPIEAGMAILIWVGFTIGAQAFQAVPRRHAPAVIAGLIPGIGAFAALISKRILGSVGYGSTELPYNETLLTELTQNGNLYARGVFALEQGWLYCSIVLTAAMVAIIDRRFGTLLCWLAGGAGLAALGIIHHYKVIATDITTNLGPAWPWVLGYLLALAALAVLRWALVSGESVEPVDTHPPDEAPDPAPAAEAGAAKTN
jgi:AGZA family xanthine/uracil permease-like MFS transporter